jgi:hypothetical protein
VWQDARGNAQDVEGVVVLEGNNKAQVHIVQARPMVLAD